MFEPTRVVRQKPNDWDQLFSSHRFITHKSLVSYILPIINREAANHRIALQHFSLHGGLMT